MSRSITIYKRKRSLYKFLMTYFMHFDWSFERCIISRVLDWNVIYIREYGRLSFWHLRRIEASITEKSNWSSCYSSLLISYYLTLVWHIGWKTHSIARYRFWGTLNSNINRLNVWKIDRYWLNNLSDYNSFSRQGMTTRFKIMTESINWNIISRLIYKMILGRI